MILALLMLPMLGVQEPEVPEVFEAPHPVEARSEILDLIDLASDEEIVELYGVQCTVGVDPLEARARIRKLLDDATDPLLLGMHKSAKKWEMEVRAEMQRLLDDTYRFYLKKFREQRDALAESASDASEGANPTRGAASNDVPHRRP